MTPRMKLWYGLAAVFVSLFAAVFVSILYANHVGDASQRAAKDAIHKSEQAMCTILVPISAIYNQPPPNDPKTELGKQLAVKFAALVQQYDCPRS